MKGGCAALLLTWTSSHLAMMPDNSLRGYRSVSNQSSSIALSSTAYQPLGSDQIPQQPFIIPRKPVRSQAVSRDGLPTTKENLSKATPIPSRKRLYVPFVDALRSWMLELLASLFSIAALLTIVIVLRIYSGSNIEDLNLPRSLTLNGLIAAIATFDRVFLVIPVSSALSQEAWIWFAKNDRLAHPRSRLRDLDRSDAASRGAWGSFIFVFTSPHRYELLPAFRCLTLTKQLSVSGCRTDHTSLVGYPYVHAAAYRGAEHRSA